MLISRKGELLWKILSTIGNASIAFSSHPSRNSLSVYRALRDFDVLQAASDNQLRTISKYIVDKKYILIERAANGTSTIAVSEAGKTILHRAALMSLRPKAQKKWDGMWRLILFDIPNLKNHQRNAFRGTLAELGFLPLQKSVWVHAYPCKDEVELLREFFGLTQKEIRLITTEDIEDDDFLRQIFKL